MMTSLLVLMALAATPARPAPTARAGDDSLSRRASRQALPVKQADQAQPPAPRFSRRNCTLNYYHYKIFSLHVAGGYSLNLLLTVFIEDEAESVAAGRPGGGAAAEQRSVFSMPLLRDVNLGYQSRDNAFFISWLKRFQRPRVQLYFKLWI
jgi:hypothetical protein